MSELFGLNIALSALYAQRQGLETTGHNISNANTEGYSRQRVRMAAAGASVSPAIYARWEKGGAGVNVTGIDRLRDSFLETRGMQEHGNDASLRRTQMVLADIEQALAEPGDNGIQAQLSDFWSAWDDVANTPGDGAARAQLLQRAQTLASSFNRAASNMASLQADVTDQLVNQVAEVNAMAARVGELNKAIQSATQAGLSPNDLADQRDLLVGKLAGLAGAITRPGTSGSVDVYVGGTALVRDASAGKLAVTGTGNSVSVIWQDSGATAQASAGELGALLDAITVRLPAYAGDLDKVAENLETSVNWVHAQGLDEDGNPGVDFFQHDATVAALGPGGLTRTLAVNPDLVADPRMVAAQDPSKGPLDGSNALQLAELANGVSSALATQLSADGLNPAGPDAAYRSFVVQLGVDADTANRRVQIQADITKQVDTARAGQSGVNLDEEMTNMLAYQHAYEAASRFLTAVDGALDTLIHSTGLVGR